MQMDSKAAEEATVLRTAQAMCAAMRTAPKTRGIDEIHTLILTGKEKDDLADLMEKEGERLDAPFFARDAGNVRASEAVVLAGTTCAQRGLNERCQLCHYENCGECAAHDSVCIYDPLDLGIALGSAVALASEAHIDNRIMFSIGKSALASNYFGPEVQIIMGVPLACAGKSPFYDRK